MGEHPEDMAKTWNVSRREQDELALESHRRAIADLIITLDGAARDHFPRRDTSMEKLARLKPVSLLDKQPFEQVRRSREASMLDRQAQMRNACFEIVFRWTPHQAAERASSCGLCRLLADLDPVDWKEVHRAPPPCGHTRYSVQTSPTRNSPAYFHISALLRNICGTMCAAVNDRAWYFRVKL